LTLNSLKISNSKHQAPNNIQLLIQGMISLWLKISKTQNVLILDLPAGRQDFSILNLFGIYNFEFWI